MAALRSLASKSLPRTGDSPATICVQAWQSIGALLTRRGAASANFTLPIAKTLKFVVNGPEDSVHFYAVCEVRPPDTDDGMM